MSQLLKPSDVATRLKAGEKLQDIFFDGAGARVAKMIGIEASIEVAGEERSIDFAISTGALDRYNSTIAAKGWQLANFIKNPVVLWAHDDSIPAIARAETTKLEGERLRSRAIFADRDVHPLADTIYRLIKAKFINAASVGWIPLKWQFVDEEGRGSGIDYLEQELLEWSVVNIPANPECLVEARSVGIDTSPLMVWAERALDLGGVSVISRAELEALHRGAGAGTVYQLSAPQIDVSQSIKDEARALKTLFVSGVLSADEFTDRLIAHARLVIVRAGRVLSAENEKKLQAAHDHVKAANDHCVAAMDHVLDVIEQNHAADKDPDDPDDDDPEQAARLRRIRLLKRRMSLAAPKETMQ